MPEALILSIANFANKSSTGIEGRIQGTSQTSVYKLSAVPIPIETVITNKIYYAAASIIGIIAVYILRVSSYILTSIVQDTDRVTVSIQTAYTKAIRAGYILIGTICFPTTGRVSC